MISINLRTEFIKSCENTRVKGVSRLFKVKSTALRLIWTCAVLSFLTIGVYQTYELLTEYLSYPKLTHIEEHKFSAKKDYGFPNMEVCSANPYELLMDYLGMYHIRKFSQIGHRNYDLY